MENNSIILLIGFIISMISIVSPIIKLNNSITKLNVTIDTVNCNLRENKEEIKCHDGKLSDHEIRIDRLEHNK